MKKLTFSWFVTEMVLYFLYIINIVLVESLSFFEKIAGYLCTGILICLFIPALLADILISVISYFLNYKEI